MASSQKYSKVQILSRHSVPLYPTYVRDSPETQNTQATDM